jgi:hypothetical protein
MGRAMLLVLSAILLLGLFSREISDPDFWWHLRTGEYIATAKRLPVPDPFAYTTAMARPAYPGEERTRHFNLTHEWLAQVLLFAIYRTSGFGGIVLVRAAMLTALCGLAGAVAWRRRRSFYGALAGAFLTASVAREFAVDRPYQVSYLLLACTIAVLETRRWMWLLPPVFLIWANCHGGFFLGWLALGAYSAEAVVLGLRKRPRNRPDPRARELWTVSALSILVSGANPNGFQIFRTLLDYRASFMTEHLLEWAHPQLWPPSAFSMLLATAAMVLLWARRRVRIVDWLLFTAFACAALTAQRNTILIGYLAPVLIVTYLPWKFRLPKAGAPDSSAAIATALLVAGGLAAGVAGGSFFQLRAAEWRYPAGAARFLLAHDVTQPLFNTYEYGGYLIWRLAPRQRVFIDGRALSETLFMDYARILYNHDASDGKSGQELLDQYGVQVIVMNTFEYVNGLVYVLAPALADPQQTTWKLVYSDAQALVLMRTPPPGVQPLDSLQVLTHMEAECELHITRDPRYTRCARGLGQVFAKVGDRKRARQWIGAYLDRPHPPDPEAEQAYQQLLSSGQ